MYVAGRGEHQHYGPGTSMVQRAKPGTFFGMGACCDSCAKGGGCSKGLGLFDSGMDFTTWGWPEWAIVGAGVYAGLSLLGDTKRGAARVRRVGKAVKKAA
jgi:hypothetical protein